MVPLPHGRYNREGGNFNEERGQEGEPMGKAIQGIGKKAGSTIVRDIFEWDQ